MRACTATVRVRGRVQGVGFRYWTQEEAERLGLAGWVRNEPDGSVKALLSGADEAVAEMLERLHLGPRGAVVSDVEILPPGVLEEVPVNIRILR
jgi:acylphosphatase